MLVTIYKAKATCMLMRTNGRTETGSAYLIQITIIYTRPMDKKNGESDLRTDTYSDYSIFGQCGSNRPCYIVPGIFKDIYFLKPHTISFKMSFVNFE